MRCPKCGYKNAEDEVFCAGCRIEMKAYLREQEEGLARENLKPEVSSEIGAERVACVECGRSNPSSDAFCSDCGAPLPMSRAEIRPAEAPPPLEAVRCPKCSAQMVPGFVLAPQGGLFSSIRWSDERNDFWGMKGEVLAPAEFWGGSISIKGFRCASCRLVLLRY